MSSTIIPSTTFIAPVVTIQSDREGMEVTIPADAGTLEGFRNWAKSDEFPERGRFSFIAGEVVADMSPENFDIHSSLKAAISASIYFLIEQENLGLFFPDGYLLSNESADLSTEPDAMFLSRKSLRAKRAMMVQTERLPGTHTELVGSPDWVLEIVSPSSSRKDKVTLRKAYYQAGIDEYWIIDARGKQIEFLMLVRGSKDFVEVKPINGWRKSPTYGVQFRITRKLDEDGFWQYKLHVKNEV